MKRTEGYKTFRIWLESIRNGDVRPDIYEKFYSFQDMKCVLRRTADYGMYIWMCTFVISLLVGGFIATSVKKDVASVAKTPESETVKLVRTFSNSDKWDSCYVYSDGHITIVDNDGERFFLISYQPLNRDGGGEIDGYICLSRWSFPTKKYIDSVVYAGLEKKKECYQSIVVLSIFEFKSEKDYNSFIIGAGEVDAPKVKKCCQPPIKISAFPDSIPLNQLQVFTKF